MKVLAGKHLVERKPHCYTLEAHEETPVFITVDIAEDGVDSVVYKLLGITGPGVMDLEALHG